MNYKKAHNKPAGLPCCHGTGDILVSLRNRHVLKKMRFLPPILQGSAGNFATFLTRFRISMKTAQNGKRFIALVVLCNGFGYFIKIAYLPNKFNV